MAKKPAPPPPHIKINLLFPQGIPQKLPIKFLKWLIAYGRYIVIPVEILVVATFIMRFKLDADLANIKERINEQVPYIESLVNDEALIRQTQFKLSTIRNTFVNNPKWNKVSQDITSQTPQGIIFTILNFDHTPGQPNLDINITGQAASSSDVASFINGLKSIKDFSDVNLVSIGKDSGKVTFAITFKAK